jgi:hypothetical protein
MTAPAAACASTPSVARVPVGQARSS